MLSLRRTPASDGDAATVCIPTGLSVSVGFKGSAPAPSSLREARSQNVRGACFAQAGRRLLPDLPWRLAAAPETFQDDLFAQCVHRLPEAVMAIGVQLSGLGQLDQGVELPGGRVAVDQIKDRGMDDEEAAVDPAVLGQRLFHE